jgi:gliding motility-associated-like protein
VIENGSLLVPNAFTPNLQNSNGGTYNPGDLNNDVFHPVVKGVINTYEMTIYSRWGETLFDTKDITIGWDGYYKGKLCTQDVYIWKIHLNTADGVTLNKTGDVLLLR